MSITKKFNESGCGLKHAVQKIRVFLMLALLAGCGIGLSDEQKSINSMQEYGESVWPKFLSAIRSGNIKIATEIRKNYADFSRKKSDSFDVNNGCLIENIEVGCVYLKNYILENYGEDWSRKLDIFKNVHSTMNEDILRYISKIEKESFILSVITNVEECIQSGCTFNVESAFIRDKTVVGEVEAYQSVGQLSRKFDQIRPRKTFNWADKYQPRKQTAFQNIKIYDRNRGREEGYLIKLTDWHTGSMVKSVSYDVEIKNNEHYIDKELFIESMVSKYGDFQESIVRRNIGVVVGGGGTKMEFSILGPGGFDCTDDYSSFSNDMKDRDSVSKLANDLAKINLGESCAGKITVIYGEHRDYKNLIHRFSVNAVDFQVIIYDMLNQNIIKNHYELSYKNKAGGGSVD